MVWLSEDLTDVLIGQLKFWVFNPEKWLADMMSEERSARQNSSNGKRREEVASLSPSFPLIFALGWQHSQLVHL